MRLIAGLTKPKIQDFSGSTRGLVRVDLVEQERTTYSICMSL